jgi:hypothetical protein
MKTLVLLYVSFVAAGVAQTTVTVTITVPSAAVPVADAYRKTLCAAYDSTGKTCIQLQYPDLQTMLKTIIAADVNNLILTPAALWAIQTNDASLPTSVKTAIVNASAAQLSVDATKTAAALAAATKITVQ